MKKESKKEAFEEMLKEAYQVCSAKFNGVFADIPCLREYVCSKFRVSPRAFDKNLSDLMKSEFYTYNGYFGSRSGGIYADGKYFVYLRIAKHQ